MASACRGRHALILIALLACCGLPHAGELETRAAIRAEIGAAFAADDFAKIEHRYAQALSTGERTSSGLYVAKLIAAAIVPRPDAREQPRGRDDHWVPVEQRIARWAAQSPDAAIVAIAQSSAYLGHGWSWRNGGAVDDAGWREFRMLDAYAKRALAALKARKLTGHLDPNWYEQLLQVAQVRRWKPKNFDALTNEALGAFPGNHDLYFAVAARHTPRWGGSVAEVARFAAYAVDRTRSEEGEAMYARIHWAVEDLLGQGIASPGVDWQRVRAGFDALVRRYPDGWNLSNFARMACTARDMPTARRVLLQLRGDVVTKAWPSEAAYRRCAEEAGAKPR